MPEAKDLLTEAKAAAKVAEALNGLEPDAAIRVLRWALDSFRGRTGETTTLPSGKGASGSNHEFSELGELFAAAGPPRHGPEKALVAAYWIQQIQGQPDFDGQTINSELKHLGHGVPNITATLGALISQRPQLAIQVRKQGTSQQARKRYRLTREGLQRVEASIHKEDA